MTWGQREYYERLWRIPVTASSLNIPPELVPGRGTDAKLNPIISDPVQIVSVGTVGHQRRASATVYPAGFPGSRAFHSSVIVTLGGGAESWVYTYGGLIPSSTTDLAFRGDLWRYRATVSGTVTWQYVGCSTGLNFVPDTAVTVGSAVPMADYCPSGRARASLVAVGETLVLSGGVGFFGALDDIWSFSLLTEMWTLIAGKSRKFAPLTYDLATPPVFTGSVITRTMGSRYDHSCDVTPGSTTVYCFGGMTARGVYVDIYRAVAPAVLSNAYFYNATQPTQLAYPFRDIKGDGTTGSKVASYLARALL